jgi:fosfomycin resistance protein FosX
MMKGLSHITFIVRDLDRMGDVLANVLGARRVYDSGNETFSLSKERFFLVGEELGNGASAHRGDSEAKFSRVRKNAGM